MTTKDDNFREVETAIEYNPQGSGRDSDFLGLKVPFQYTSEVRFKDPKTGAEKGEKDEAYHLIPWDAMDEVARVYAYGAKKYSDRNWEKGYPWSKTVAAAFRHLRAVCCGESIDPESKLPHAAHLAFHALALLRYRRAFPEKNDLPKVPLP